MSSCTIIGHDLEFKREYLQKGETYVWHECRKCDYKTEKRQQWSVGAIEMIWQAIEEIKSDIDFLKAKAET